MINAPQHLALSHSIYERYKKPSLQCNPFAGFLKHITVPRGYAKLVDYMQMATLNPAWHMYLLYACRFTFSPLENTHSKTCRHTSLYLRQTHLLCHQSLLCLEV